jgi:hypothetical protein
VTQIEDLKHVVFILQNTNSFPKENIMATAKVSQSHKTVVVWRAKNQPLLCKRLCETPEPLVIGGTLDVGELKYVQTHPTYGISDHSSKGLRRNLSLALTETLHNMYGPQETLGYLIKGLVCIGTEDPTVKTVSTSASGFAIVGSLADIPADVADPNGMLTKLGSVLFNEKRCNHIILIRCVAVQASAFAAQDEKTTMARVLLAIRGV